MTGLTYLFVILLYLPNFKSVSTSLGKLFAVSAPRMQFEEVHEDPFIVFHLVTFAEKIMVDYEGYLFTAKESRRMTVKKGDVTVHEAEKSLLPSHEMGPTATFKFHASTNFGLTVYLLNSIGGAASFQAVPVAEWGTIYIVVTGNNQPFIQLTSSEVPTLNNIKVSFSDYSASGKAVFNYENIEYRAKAKMKISLKSWESFTISNCSHNDEHKDVAGRLDGTRVFSTHLIGVISGSCRTYIAGSICDQSQRTSDMVAEMMFPLKKYQKHMVFPNIPKSKQRTEVIAIAARTHTNLTFQHGTSIMLKCAGEILKSNILTGSYTIDSDKGALVLYMHSSYCHVSWERYEASPNLCIILPTRSFHYTYIWRTTYQDFNLTDFVLLVARAHHKHQIILDGKFITNSNWENTSGLIEFSVANVELTKGLHKVRSQNMATFGCYIYGFGRDKGYMHWGGYQECGPGPNSNDIADLIDNDCDGVVDEEIKDNLDNDGDGLVDEDLGETKSYLLYYILGVSIAVVLAAIVAYGVIHRNLQGRASSDIDDAPDVDEFREMVKVPSSGFSNQGPGSDAGSGFKTTQRVGSEVDDKSYVLSEVESSAGGKINLV